MGRKVLRRLGGLALTLAAVIGLSCVVLTAASLTIDVRPLIFRSGSMSPAIPAGSLAIAYPVDATAVRTGDIVSIPYQDNRVTHRVVAVEEFADGAVSLRLRGDANDVADPQPYIVRQVDRVLFAVPVLGTVVAWLSRPPGVFVLAGYAALLLSLIFRRGSSGGTSGRRAAGRDHPSDRRPVADDLDRPRRSAGISRRVRAAFGAGLLGGTASLAQTPSWAAFSDPVEVSGSTISSYTVPTTTLTCSANGSTGITLSWTAVPNATNYTLRYGTGGQFTDTTTATSRSIIVAVTNGTAWVNVNRTFGSAGSTTTWTSVNSNIRTYNIGPPTRCT